MDETTVFFQQIINGISMGLIYALVALGYSMIFGVLGYINFAHGDIYMVGGFIGFTLIGFLNWGLGIAIVFSALAVAFLGIMIERLAYKPLRRFEGFLDPLLVCTIGVSIVLQTAAQLIWGNETKPMGVEVANRIYYLGDLYVSQMQLIIGAVAIVLMIALGLFVNKTNTGIAIRAVAQDIVSAKLMGINVNRIVSITYAIGSALAAIAGVLVGVYFDAVYPTMGYTAGIKAFTATCLGGIGSLPGAVFASLIIGVVEALGTSYFSAAFRDGYSFIILLFTLVFLPSGLVRTKREEKV